MEKTTYAYSPKKECLICKLWTGDRNENRGIYSCDSGQCGYCALHETETACSDKCSDFVNVTQNVNIQDTIRKKKREKEKNDSKISAGEAFALGYAGSQLLSGSRKKKQHGSPGLFFPIFIVLAIIALGFGGYKLVKEKVFGVTEPTPAPEVVEEQNKQDWIETRLDDLSRSLQLSSIVISSEFEDFFIKNEDLFPAKKKDLKRIKKLSKAEVSINDIYSNADKYKNKLVHIKDAKVSEVAELTNIINNSELSVIGFDNDSLSDRHSCSVYYFGKPKAKKGKKLSIYAYVLESEEIYVDPTSGYGEHAEYLVGCYIG